jgi:hypothetical protein
LEGPPLHEYYLTICILFYIPAAFVATDHGLVHRLIVDLMKRDPRKNIKKELYPKFQTIYIRRYLDIMS